MPMALPATDVRRTGMDGALTPLTVVSARPPDGTGARNPCARTTAQRLAASTIVRVVRILLVTPGLGLGGSEQLTLAYARGLMARGHETLIVNGPPELFGDADVAGLARHRMPERLSARTAAAWFRSLRSVAAEFQPDVAYTQSVRTTVIVSAALPLTPLLATLHGIERSEERQAALLLRAARARVTAVSEASADGVRRHRFAPRIEVVPPGVDIEALERSALAPTDTVLPDRVPRVVCVARHYPVKGVDVLVDAFPQVLAAVPEAGLVLVGAGDDYEALVARVARARDLRRGALRRLPAQPALPISRAPTSPCSRPAARDCPSSRSRRWRSAAPSWRRPSAARPTSCARGTPAGSCRPSSPRRSPPAIVEALLDPAERARRAANGRALVERSYSLAAMLDRVEELCSELAVTRRPNLRPAYVAARAYQRARLARPRLSPPAWNGVRILGYHRIAAAPDALAVSPARFREQMRAVAESGAQPVRLDRALDLLRGPVHGRYVCVTFDDGYRDNLARGRAGAGRVRDPGHDLRAQPDHRRRRAVPLVRGVAARALVGRDPRARVRRPRRRAVPHAHASPAAAGRRRALARGDRGLEARDRAARPVRGHELLLPGGPLRCARGRVRARGRLRGGGDHEPRRQRRAAAICSSCGARSSTAPTTCASSAASSTACSTARPCSGGRCTHVARAPPEAPASMDSSGRDRAPAPKDA